MYGLRYYSQFYNADNQLIRFEILKRNYEPFIPGTPGTPDQQIETTEDGHPFDITRATTRHEMGNYGLYDAVYDIAGSFLQSDFLNKNFKILFNDSSYHSMNCYRVDLTPYDARIYFSTHDFITSQRFSDPDYNIVEFESDPGTYEFYRELIIATVTVYETIPGEPGTPDQGTPDYQVPEGLNLDGNDPIRIIVKEKDRDESIISKGGVFNVYQESPFKFKDLFAQNELEHQIKIFKDGALIFLGFIEPELFDQELTHENTIVSIPFSDGLRRLEHYNVNDIALPSNPEYDDFYFRLIVIMKEILKKSGLNLPIMINSTLFEEDMTTTGRTMFGEVYLVRDILQDDDLKQLLENILKGFRICQIGGKWVIDRLKDMANPVKNYVQYNTDGTEEVIEVENEFKELGEYREGNPYLEYRSGMREIEAIVKVIDIENFIKFDNFKEAKDFANYPLPLLAINDVYKHFPIDISKELEGYKVTFNAQFQKYIQDVATGSVIITRLKPFSFNDNMKDTLDVKIIYEIPIDVLNQKKGITTNNHFISIIGLTDRLSTVSPGSNRWIVFNNDTQKWYFTNSIRANLQSFTIDYDKVFVRQDERTITHTISVKLDDIIDYVEGRREDWERGDWHFFIHVAPLYFGGNKETAQNAAPVQTIIKDIIVSIHEEVEPNNEFVAVLNEDYREKKSIPMVLSDFKSANFANTMYCKKLRRNPDGSIYLNRNGETVEYLGKTQLWTDDQGETKYDYNTKFLIDIYHIYSKGRHYINGMIKAPETIEPNRILQEEDMLFYLAGFEWDLKWNEYQVRLNEYSNTKDFEVVE